jgi:hypothetical protein
MSYFREAALTHEGREFRFSVEEGRAQEMGAADWHGERDPSSWLALYVFEAVRQKVGDAPQAVALELAAKAMNISVEKLVSLLRWVEEYARWHDGDPDYKALEE